MRNRNLQLLAIVAVLLAFFNPARAVKVAVVKSWGLAPVFTELNDNWQAYGNVPLTVDTSLVNASSFTYQDLVNTDADVLWLSNPAGGAQRYSPAEIDAIRQYVSEGHSILGTFSVLQYSDIDHRSLAPVFGLREDIVYNTTEVPASQVFDLLGDHPLFRNVPDPYVSDGWTDAQVPANDLTWDASDLGGAQLLAQTDDKRGVITWYETESYYAIYVSKMVEYHGNPTDTQFLYNALTISEQPAIEAIIDINPNTLNLESKGEWITCYIRLPEDYDVADIDIHTILLNGQVGSDRSLIDEAEQMLMAKFPRSAAQEMLEPGEVELTVSGELNDGSKFEGSDTIRVIDKGAEK
jgi:hypothetical protein